MTAQWTPGIYAITLNNQSATSAGTATIYEKYATGWYGNSAATSSISTITKPTKTGYTFKGYYTSTSCSGTQRINASGTITAGNTTYTSTGTLYACWEQDVSTFESFKCSSLSSGGSTTVTDTRNNQNYTIKKDTTGLCWMTSDFNYNPTRTSSDGVITYTKEAAYNNIVGSWKLPSLSDFKSLTSPTDFGIPSPTSATRKEYYDNNGWHSYASYVYHTDVAVSSGNNLACWNSSGSWGNCTYTNASWSFRVRYVQ